MPRLFAPADIAPLVYARIVFGALMVVEMGRFFSNDWIRRYYIQPEFYFGYPGFEWVRPLPGALMYALFVVLTVAAACVALGLFHRVAAASFGAGLLYVFLLDQTNYLNHLYLIWLVSFLFAAVPAVPAADAGSLDAKRRRTSAQFVPAWTVWLLLFQLSLVYVFGAVAKLDYDWLRGAPAASFLDNWELTLPLAQSELACRAFAVSGLLFDLLIVPALLYRRTRWFATAAAVLFHLSNAQLFSIGIFPWLMLALTPLFWPAAWLRGLLERLRVLSVVGKGRRPEFRSVPAVAWVLAVFVTVQLLLPLRHWLYPGQVNWTEEGHNFSWHMKLRVKQGATRFWVIDQQTGEIEVVDPETILTRRQARKMATRPDMIMQFAHELGRRAKQRGASVMVKARAVARLNDRAAQYLVDPEVDLLTRGRSLLAADWIVPLGSGPKISREDAQALAEGD